MTKVKITLLFASVLILSQAIAQPMNVESAYNYTKNKNYVRAKEAIDKAAENPATNNDPRMWFYRGKTYLGLWKDTTVVQADYPDAILIAGNSFVNCIETDKKKRYVEESRYELVNVAASAFNIANIAYNKSNYDRAIQYFDLILKMSPYDTEGNFKRNNFADDVINQYLAYVYRDKKDNKKSKEYLQKLIDKKFNDPYIYTMMAEIVEEEGNKELALDFIEQGRESYEDSRALLYEEIRLSLELNKTAELTKKFKDAIQLDPYNAQFHFYLGVLLEQSKDTLGAEASYRKAVDLDNGSYDAMLSLGQILFSRGYGISKSLNNMDISTYKKDGSRVEAEMNKLYDEALKYVEDCYSMRPKDYDCLKTLKNLYTVKKRYEDVQRIDKEMKAAKKQKDKE